MNTPLTNAEIALLEEKWLNNTISQEEARLYAEWYNAHQDEALKIPSNLALSKLEHKRILLDAIGDKLDLALTENNPSSAKRIPIFKWIAAAAILAFMAIGASYYIYHNYYHSTQLAQNDMPPGNDAMTLKIGENATFRINDKAKNIVYKKEGFSIIQKKGEIQYVGSPQQIIQNKAITAYGQKYKILLPDSTQIWLNAGSSLTYQLPFGKNRIVHLVGEAYFEVHKNPSQPFIVQTKEQTIRVLGTHFSVTAYPNEKKTTSLLLEGSIALTPKMGKTILINPNQEVQTENGQFSSSSIIEEANQQISWTKNRFYFSDVTILNLMLQLQRWYNVKCNIAPNVDANITFSGATEMNQNLSEVLKVLQMGGVNCQLSNGTIYVRP